MRLRTILTSVPICLFLPQLLLSQSSFKNFIREKTYADFSISTTQGSMQLALGYKFEEYFGIGFSVNQLERGKTGIGVNIRGTNMKNHSQVFGLYYTAGWWHTVNSFDDFESNSLFELGAGVRYKDLGLTIGYGRYSDKTWVSPDAGDRTLETYTKNTVQLKLSYLANSYRGERPFLRKMFGGDTLRSNPHFDFDVAVGRAEGTVSGGITQNYPVGAAALDLSLVRQFNDFTGVGVSLHAAGSAALGARYSLTSIGISFRGEPGVFYYKATVAAITRFSWVNDWEFPGEKFDLNGGLQPMFHLQGGIRLFRRLLLGGGFQWAPRIRGTYRHYDLTDITDPVLDLKEERTVRFSSWQVMAGVVF